MNQIRQFCYLILATLMHWVCRGSTTCPMCLAYKIGFDEGLLSEAVPDPEETIN